MPEGYVEDHPWPDFDNSYGDGQIFGIFSERRNAEAAVNNGKVIKVRVIIEDENVIKYMKRNRKDK